MSRHLRAFATFALVAALLPAVGMAADPLPGKSPFGPPAETTKAGAAATAPDGDYELMGMVATPKGPMLSIARQGANKGTLWIPVGGSREEITIVSYDARHERAVIRVNGHSRTLTMRKSVIVAGENTAPEPEATPAPDSAKTETDPAAAAETPATDASSSDAPATTATTPEPSSPPASDEAAAEEARNLVSDLMDIGQQQRQAYEAAARAAGQTTAEPEATPPADESAVEATPDSEPAPAADESTQPTGSDDTAPATRSDDHGGG